MNTNTVPKKNTVGKRRSWIKCAHMEKIRSIFNEFIGGNLSPVTYPFQRLAGFIAPEHEGATAYTDKTRLQICLSDAGTYVEFQCMTAVRSGSRCRVAATVVF